MVSVGCDQGHIDPMERNAAKAAYFERRAAQTAAGQLKEQYRAAAEHYGRLASRLGQEPVPQAGKSTARRQRLIEMSRAYEGSR